MALVYNRLTINDGKLDQESIELVKSLLGVDEDHKIIICHPNLIFNKKPITQENRELTDINSEFIKADLGEVEKCSYTSFAQDATATWNYVYLRLNLGNNEKYNSPKYLAVVDFDQNHAFQIKGIIREEKKNIYIALNPNYQKADNGSRLRYVIWQKAKIQI